MTDFSLEFDDISGGYGGGLVVRDVSASVSPGKVLCVLGRNGVGKSTLLKLACGYLPLTSGSVRLYGRDLAGVSAFQRNWSGMTYCPQERVVFDDLSVAENLLLMSPHKNVDAFESYFHTFPRLAERRDQPAGTLSGGEKKLLSLVRGLSENKPVIVIDEPTEGVQYENVMKMANLVNARKAEGTAFIIVEQNLTLVDEIADELLVLDQGKIALAGSASAISRADIQAHMIV